MTRRCLLRTSVTLGFAVAALLGCGAIGAAAKPILMPTLQNEIQQETTLLGQHVAPPVGSLQLPAPPCPENGTLPSPFSNCGLPELPATTLPFPGNMSYWGGHVQVKPHVYLIYYGWGEPGAFPKTATCQTETLSEGGLQAKLKCDPDGAGKRMADFVSQLGGTQWAGTSNQYYQTDASRAQQHITNPSKQLAGIWVDDQNKLTSASQMTYTAMAQEAARAVKRFHVTDLADANFVIAQPQNFSDPVALSTGYCAFHDYTEPNLEGGIYNGIQAGISYTNMPYILSINSGGANVCGENAVNSGSAGTLDGISIVLGHEIEETVTDPGAEDILGGSGVNSQQTLGGWYDTFDANENGDKCAWVGEPLVGGVPGAPNVVPIPGAMGDITGNKGTTFAVQSLWSNDSAGGAGYCAGAGTDLPTG